MGGFEMPDQTCQRIANKLIAIANFWQFLAIFGLQSFSGHQFPFASALPFTAVFGGHAPHLLIELTQLGTYHTDTHDLTVYNEMRCHLPKPTH